MKQHTRAVETPFSQQIFKPTNAANNPTHKKKRTCKQIYQSETKKSEALEYSQKKKAPQVLKETEQSCPHSITLKKSLTDAMTWQQQKKKTLRWLANLRITNTQF